jgi:hypothetical protein
MTKHQVSVAAEAFAAGVFAQAGLSVFVQYGANQPGYDLVVTNEQNNDPAIKTIHVSVKGSSDGGWKLAAPESGVSIDDALKAWQQDNQGYVFCFVQFEEVDLGEMPRIYIATAEEVAECLKTHHFGATTGVLVEEWTRVSGPYKGKTQKIPDEWEISRERINEMFR